MKFDLHLHTFFSDGKYSPEGVVDLALERGLNGIAITDHDTTLGIERAIKHSEKYKDFQVVSGIEFGCIYNDMEVHILGYFIDYNNKELLKVTDFLKEAREERGVKMVDKLRGLGINIEYEEVRNFSEKGFVGRVPIAKVLVEKDYAANINEAFNKYLDRGKIAYIEKEGVNIQDAIEIIKTAGGISALAHPGLLKDSSAICYCINHGINAIECIHSKHTSEQEKLFKTIAKKNKLIITGGSDCHGEIINGDLLLGKYFMDSELVLKLKEGLNDIV